jgi:AraC-like DNA-binding protein
VVAECCGLGSAESLRRVFHRHLGVSPDAYRRRIRTTARGGVGVGGAAAIRHEAAATRYEGSSA